MIEQWKSCANTLYEVSNLGNIRRVGSINNRKKIRLKNGYETVMFSTEGKVTCMYIHRLVAEAFIPNPNNYPEINHIDHNKSNNVVENLEWCNRKYNVQDGSGITLYVYNLEGTFIGKYNSIRECERLFNIGHRSLNTYIDSNRPKNNLLFYTNERK